MNDDVQAEVTAFLSRPETFGGEEVQRVETHSAVVFLVGKRALKLKRAVKYSYLDFSTLDARRRSCEAEVAVNRRTAPALYTGVTSVTREPDGTLALQGAGTPVEWLVEMVRFDEQLVLDRMAAAHTLDPGLMPGLAKAVARFHADAERRRDFGGYDGIERVIRGNASGFARYGQEVLDPEACDALTRASLAAADAERARLEHRRENGFVRRCHGDLHLRNLVALDGQATLFDAIEFNDDLACIDVWYDTAFLLMDLVRRGLHGHANAVLNGYVLHSNDVDGLALLPLFLSCRAGVRAMTSATAAGLATEPEKRTDLQGAAREYLALAQRLLAPTPARLIAIGGLSGSGKSTVARRLAPLVGGSAGAVVLRSDELRKVLRGVDPLTRLGPEGYTAEMNARVYEELAARAASVLRAGRTVVADAVFARAGDRQTIEAAARAAARPFCGLWLGAPAETLRARVRTRGADASDADIAVLDAQLAQLTDIDGWTTLDAAGPPDAVVDAARAAVGGVSTSPPGDA